MLQTVPLFRLCALAVAAIGCACTRGPSDRPAAALASRVDQTPAQGGELLGTRPPEWQVAEWVGEAPTLESLRGRVVLVRWWTAPDCPFCGATAPTLNELHGTYAAQGLAVVGMFHPKDNASDRASVAARAAEFGFRFPVGIDRDWRTLKRWWLDGHERDFTSVSFLLDRRGIVRHIHPGGEIRPGDAAHSALVAKVREALAE